MVHVCSCVGSNTCVGPKLFASGVVELDILAVLTGCCVEEMHEERANPSIFLTDSEDEKNSSALFLDGR